jgi:pimeloyl-ACP methyl ester carboxylesterase
MTTNIATRFFSGLITAALAAGSPQAAEPPLRSPAGHFAHVGDLRMYYEVHGHSGDYLVLIHGGGSTIGTSFGRILPLLAGNLRVIAVELQGHGHTPDRDAPESFEQDADDVAGLLQGLRIAKASFFGFSNGGNAAMQMAIRHPEIVDKLILASTFYRRDGLIHGFFDGMEHATLEAMPQSLKDAFLQITPDPNKLLTMFNKDKERMLRFSDWKDGALSSISAPTLIMNGDQDVILTSHALAMSRLIAHSRLIVLPATHGSYLGAAAGPDIDRNLIALTSEVVKDFLRKN